MDWIFRPASSRAVLRGDPIRSRNWVNSALRMLRPTMAGRSVRTTVSTSGSSGIRSGKVHEDIAFFDAHRIDRDAQVLIERTRARGRVELPRVPGAGDERAFERSL